MAQVGTSRVGQPLKYLGGWSSANKQIYLSESTYVTGFERTHLPHTQQQDTLFTITR